MRLLHPYLLLAVLGAVAVVRAQEAPAEAAAKGEAQPVEAVESRAQKAIEQYEAFKKQRGKDAQRIRSLHWLGEVDAPEVTEYLRKELAAAGDGTTSIGVVQAIGKVKRKELEEDLTALILRPKAQAAARTAAVSALAALGDRSSDRLIAIAFAGDDVAPAAIRRQVTAALIATAYDRTLRALVPLLERGPAEERMADLRLFAGVRDLAPLTLARIKLVRHDHLPLASMAWRQLAVEGSDRAKALALDVIERLPENVPADVAADVIVGLCIVRDADFYPAILRMARVNGTQVRQAIRDAAEYAATDPALLKFLVHDGLEDEFPDSRAAARELLQKAPPEAVQPLLAKVRAALKRPKPETLDLAIGLHDLLRKDPTWRNDLLAMAVAKEPEARTAALSMLTDLGADDAREVAQKSLAAKEWALRSAAFRYLSRFRDVSSIPLLIARVGKEEGRLADELNQALFRHTGTRCFTKKDWESWWRERSTGFVLPHEQTVRTSTGSGGGATSAYYEIPLVSSRVAFLVDQSGSMNAQVGTDKKFTRLEAAKKQLAQVLTALPSTHQANLIPYDSRANPVWKELRPLDDDNRKRILASVNALQPRGGTNIFDTLELAFRDGSVDTLYLLTDGQPSAGRLTDPADILAEVTRWYRTKQIVVHCIAIGLESDLLKRIAEVTGGEYRSVK
ncbi:MAG: hypothetical protein RL398_253 [Planctomycetota bacterium]